MDSLSDARRGPSSHLFGREAEQQALRSSLADAFSGRGSLTVIAGEAGAGKTTLAGSLCREAAAEGAIVLIGRCYDVPFTPLYGAWVDLFAGSERVDGVLPLPSAFAHHGTLETSSNQPALLEEVRSFLVDLSAVHPVVLLFEDLQWADLASCELLRYVAREAAAHRLMIMATISEDALGRAQPLYRLLPALEREAAAERINLPRLRPEDLHQLVTSSYRLRTADVVRLVAYVYEMTRGNALFATELLRALEEQRILQREENTWLLDDLGHVGMPLRLRQVIDNRLLRLPEKSQDLLAAAAVIGPEVPFSLWTSIFGGDEETMLRVLEEAADAHLVEPTPDGISFRFVHALVHEALYEGIFPVRRRVMHRRVGEALAALPAPDPDAVARHFHSADDDRAGEWLVCAGQRAEGAGAHLTAVERYEAALRPLEASRAPAAERAWVLLSLAVLRRMDDSWRAITYVDMAMRLAQECDDHDLSARVLLGRGLVRCYAGIIEDGIKDLIAGVAAVDSLRPGGADQRVRGASVDKLLNWGALVYWLAVAGRSDEARSLADDHLRQAARSVADEGKTAGIAGAYWGLAFVHAMQGRVEEARLASAAAAAAYRKLGQHRLAFIALRDELVHVTLPYHTDDHGERERLATALRRMADQGNAARAFVDAIDNVRYPLLQMMVIEGRWDEVHQVVDAMGEYGIPILRHVVGSVLGPVARAQGDVDLAWRLVRETWPAGPSTEPGNVECYHTLPLQRLAVELSLDDGDLLGARAWLEAHDRWLAWSGFVLGEAEAQCLWARYELARGHPREALPHAEAALERATKPQQPLALLSAHRLLGEMKTAAGRYEEAEPHFEEALSLAEACAAPYERALTLLSWAEHGLASSAATAVPGFLAETRALCEPLKATPALERVARLEDVLAAQQPVVISYPAGLTEREAEVLGLLARGLSDKEIAALLHLSPRTVGRHVEKAYRKVGVHRRAEAAVFAMRHGLLKDNLL
ncbi:MAG: helix-turn-helix transcriptional regulator [Actinoallomurus sp.]